jgi:hypothetical protein
VSEGRSNWTVRDGEKVYKPLSREKLVQLIANEKIPSGAVVSTDGKAWFSIEEFSQIEDKKPEASVQEKQYVSACVDTALRNRRGLITRFVFCTVGLFTFSFVMGQAFALIPPRSLVGVFYYIFFWIFYLIYLPQGSALVVLGFGVRSNVRCPASVGSGLLLDVR